MPLFDPTAVYERSLSFEGTPPQEILAWAFAEYGQNIAISTAFGVEGCALIDMAVRVNPDVAVLTVDTDFLFPESRDLLHRMVDRYGIRPKAFRGTVSREEQDRVHGPALYERDPDRCCALRKVEPMHRALAGLDAWITGLRRDQGRTRAAIPILEVLQHPEGAPLIKVNPLASWTRADVWAYVTAHQVPYNPLLDRGYRSIGCWPCTRPVHPTADDERAGRWAGHAKTECGIHTSLAPRR